MDQKKCAEKQKRQELLESLCRSRGLPVTVQRRVILDALLDHEDHPAVDQLFQGVRERIPGISRTTVYRALEALVRLGVARKTNHLDPMVRFDGNIARHHHLVCRACNRISDFRDPNLDRIRLPDLKGTGFQVVDYSVQFEGLCSVCQRKKSAGLKRTKGITKYD